MSSNNTFAVDISGSTGNSAFYWEYVRQIYEKNKSTITKIVEWDDRTSVISEATLMDYIRTRRGRNGTSPSCIISNLKNGDNLILITDGEIDRSECARVSSLMEGKKLNSCHAHIINRNPDVSVVCGFTRGITSTITTYGSEVKLISSINSESFKILERLETMSMTEFMDQYDEIYHLLLNQMVGISRMDKKLHDIFVGLKRKFVDEFTRTLSTVSMHSALSEGRYEDAKMMSRTMIAEYYGESPITAFSSKFDRLIGLVSGRSDFSVNQYNSIKTNTFSTATIVASEDHESLTTEGVATMECPIMLTDDAMVIPILAGAPILYGEEKKVIDQVMKNPLSILSFKHLVEKIRARLSQPIGLFGYCRIYNDNRLHPLTREPMSGCIPLGSTREYVNEATNAIMHLFTGGRILGNVDLYYAVLYFICKDIEYLSDVQPMIQDQMIYRMNNHKTSASLSGMSEYVGTKILFKDAIWFVLTSGSLYTNNAIIPIRQHAFVYDKLLELNALNGYPISADDLQYCKLTRLMLSMLQQCKKDKYFREKIQAMYQDHIVLDLFEAKTYIFFNRLIDMSDYSASEINDIKLAYKMAQKVNPSLSASDITIEPIDLNSVTFPTFQDIWHDEDEYRHYVCDINIITCRPMYRMTNGSTWEDSYNSYYAGHRMLSLNKYFGQYVVENSQYPTVEQLMRYTMKCESSRGDTLPTTIRRSCEYIIFDYERVMTELEPDEFARRFTASVNRVDRERLEAMV